MKGVNFIFYPVGAKFEFIYCPDGVKNEFNFSPHSFLNNEQTLTINKHIYPKKSNLCSIINIFIRSPVVYFKGEGEGWDWGCG